MDARELPVDLNLEQLEQSARNLLSVLKSGDSDALTDIRDKWPEANQFDDADLTRRIKRRYAHWIMRAARKGSLLSLLPRWLGQMRRIRFPSLADTKFVVACEFGFENWSILAGHIAGLKDPGSPVSRFEAAVDAVVSGDIDSLEKALRDDPGLIRRRSTRSHRATLLHYVSANGVEDFRQKTPGNAVEVAQILLKAGAQVDEVLADGDSTTLGLVATSVHPLLAGVQIPLLEALLEARAAVDGVPGGWNPLLAALHNGRGQAAVYLAERGARLDLEGAAGTGRLEIVKSFYNDDGSLKPSATKEQMKAGFAWACQFGRTSVVDFLLQNGMDITAKLRHDGQTGLHWAAYCAHADTVKLLLARNAQIDIKDGNHDGTPLDWALYGWAEPAAEGRRDGYYEVVALLISAGAAINEEWLGDPDRESSILAKVQADPRMIAALKGELHMTEVPTLETGGEGQL
jgi:ankyrin repeat protein